MASEQENLDQMVSDALRGSWVHRFLPQSIWPYAQLARWERPIGWQLLMWPCWWSVMLAWAYYKPSVMHVFPPSYYYPGGSTGKWGYTDIGAWLSNHFDLGFLNALYSQLFILLLLFSFGAFVMRGAGCTYNDLVDQNIDDKVARTRSRPLPSGRVTRRNAWIFLALQLVIGLIILLQFNQSTQIVGAVSLVTILVYPFMKRITWWPQLFLGLAFSWGALVGWTAISSNLHLPAIIMYLGCICWVIGYDTIYAHQDIEDDMKVGVKSTARLFGHNTKTALLCLYGAALNSFAAAFYMLELAWPAFIGLIAVGLHMLWQVTSFKYDDPALCLKLFKSNNVLGWIMFLGLFVTASGFIL